MQLSVKTINVLKNFSSINPSIVLKPALLSDLRTASLAVSCISGSMLPMTTVAIGFAGSGGSFSIIDFSHDIFKHTFSLF